ncbi:hypothetical protein [Aureispira anguillae]|uniref:Uncharacterized protein n=1 Tax=Aureispira anguillae TaxID=2864201 RepID=A0A916DW85_9BACT|nr:hypothetical protein [Aureispira anguillae]BDS14547.1 hypothetical protein AsAng_0053280 [Aureispira anguillae]
MKAFFSKPITWLLTFFNVGIYNLSDGIDSLIMKLNFIGLHNHANTIITLSQSIEYQQGIIIILDTLKCLFIHDQSKTHLQIFQMALSQIQTIVFLFKTTL